MIQSRKSMDKYWRLLENPSNYVQNKIAVNLRHIRNHQADLASLK
jgi:hypothetical protein